MYKSNINLNFYKTFYDVAKYGSISKAAEASYTSQPAISKAIKKLESDLNTTLFYRKSNGVDLTEKGKELLYYVEKSYSNLITAERVMIETDNLERGKLSIGMPSNLGIFFLFDKVVAFHEKYPNIEISVITGGTAYLLDLFRSHKVDFIVDTAPIIGDESDELTIKKLRDVNYKFAVKKDVTSFTYKDIKSIKDLVDKPLVLPIPGTANRNALDEILNKYNIEVNNVINIHTSEMILSFVNHGLGIGYIMEDIISSRVKDGEIEVIEVKEKLPTVDLEIAYDYNLLTTAPKKFITDYLEVNIEE